MPAARTLCLSLLAALLLIAPSALPAGAAQRPMLHDETVQTLQRYLAIDTTNPPGNEMRTARFLKEILDREGIQNEIFDLGGGRANLVARLRGNGSGRPIVLLHHMDVVEADAKHWTHPPFGGTLAGGRIHGRGAVDIKGKGIIDLMTMVAVKRSGMPLRRDLVLLAVADEEAGSIGAHWVVEKRPDLVRDAEVLLDEGAAVRPDGKGRASNFLVGIAEKYALWVKVGFQGRAGHASLPFPDSAVDRAVRAAGRVLAWKRPCRLIPELRDNVAMVAASMPWKGLPGARKSLEASLSDARFLEALCKNPLINACVRDTIAITRLSGSEKINVVPNEASFGLDCRLLPGTDIKGFMRELRARIADPSAKVELEYGNESDQIRMSSADSPFITALRKVVARDFPGARVVPGVLPITTDSSLFRTLGIQCYGFEPYVLTDEDQARAHGNDESIPTAAVGPAVDLMIAIVRQMNER